MALNDLVKQELNKQMNLEIESAFIYLSLSIHFSNKNFLGLSMFFHKRFEEELIHANKFQQFLLDNNYKPMYNTTVKSAECCESNLYAFDLSLAHERKVTESIHNILKLAREVGDVTAEPFLLQFIAEQIEEEAMFMELVGVTQEQLGEDHLFLLDVRFRDKYKI